MVDRENVIKGLEIHTKPNSRCVGCPYPNNGLCGDQLYMDALALLKEQGEQTRPVFNGRYWECEQCRERYKDILVVKEYKHCPGCGRKLMWNG